MSIEDYYEIGLPVQVGVVDVELDPLGQPVEKSVIGPHVITGYDPGAGKWAVEGLNHQGQCVRRMMTAEVLDRLNDRKTIVERQKRDPDFLMEYFCIRLGDVLRLERATQDSDGTDKYYVYAIQVSRSELVLADAPFEPGDFYLVRISDGEILKLSALKLLDLLQDKDFPLKRRKEAIAKNFVDSIVSDPGRIVLRETPSPIQPASLYYLSLDRHIGCLSFDPVERRFSLEDVSLDDFLEHFNNNGRQKKKTKQLETYLSTRLS